jgi:hypothetical protein
VSSESKTDRAMQGALVTVVVTSTTSTLPNDCIVSITYQLTAPTFIVRCGNVGRFKVKVTYANSFETATTSFFITVLDDIYVSMSRIDVGNATDTYGLARNPLTNDTYITAPSVSISTVSGRVYRMDQNGGIVEWLGGDDIAGPLYGNMSTYIGRPYGIAVNPKTGVVYVASRLSDTVGAIFQINESATDTSLCTADAVRQPALRLRSCQVSLIGSGPLYQAIATLIYRPSDGKLIFTHPDAPSAGGDIPPNFRYFVYYVVAELDELSLDVQPSSLTTAQQNNGQFLLGDAFISNDDKIILVPYHLRENPGGGTPFYRFTDISAATLEIEAGAPDGFTGNDGYLRAGPETASFNALSAAQATDGFYYLGETTQFDLYIRAVSPQDAAGTAGVVTLFTTKTEDVGCPRAGITDKISCACIAPIRDGCSCGIDGGPKHGCMGGNPFHLLLTPDQRSVFATQGSTGIISQFGPLPRLAPRIKSLDASPTVITITWSEAVSPLPATTAAELGKFLRFSPDVLASAGGAQGEWLEGDTVLVVYLLSQQLPIGSSIQVTCAHARAV